MRRAKIQTFIREIPKYRLKKKKKKRSSGHNKYSSDGIVSRGGFLLDFNGRKVKIIIIL